MADTHNEYRCYYYKDLNGDKYVCTPTDLATVNRQIDHLVDTGKAIGGGIEEYIEGFGWCIYTESET